MASKIAGLLKWCKVQCEGYKHVALTNFTSSWKSGLAFCAIIHRHRPDLIDYEALPPNDTYGNSKLAFDAALSLGIPALLDPEDMVQMTVPDKLCIITYVSQYYNYFRDKPADGGPSVKMPSKRPSSSLQTSQPEKKQVPMKEIRENEVQPSKRGTLDDKCLKCKKKVYLLERQIDCGKLYHRHCFRELDRISTLERNKGTEQLLKASRRLESSNNSRESSTITKIEPNSEISSNSRVPNSQTGHGDLLKLKSTPATIANNKSTIASKDTSGGAVKSKFEIKKEPKTDHQLGDVFPRTNTTTRHEVPLVTSKTIISNEINSKPAIYTSISKLENNLATSFSVAKFSTSASPLPAEPSATLSGRKRGETTSPKTMKFSLYSSSNSVLKSPQKLDDEGNEAQNSGSQKDNVLNIPIELTITKSETSKCDEVQSKIDEKMYFGEVRNEDASKRQKEENLDKSLNQPDLLNWKASAREGVFQGNVSSDAIEKAVGVSSKDVDLKSVKAARFKFWRYTNVAKRRVSAEESTSEAEIARKLKKLDGSLLEVEGEGRKLEEAIRSGSEESMEQEEEMMKKWLLIVKRRSELIREESELIYQRQQQILEKHHEELEYQLRFLLNIPDTDKNDEEKKVETEILSEILKIVESRNKIVESIETDRLRYVQEDEQYEKLLSNPKVNKKKSKSSTGKKWFQKKKKQEK